jgi:hypothetical protein
LGLAHFFGKKSGGDPRMNNAMGGSAPNTALTGLPLCGVRDVPEENRDNAPRH